MRRPWILLSLGMIVLLVGQLDTPAPPADYVDPVALAAATTAAGWHCALPHRNREQRTQARGIGRAPLTISEGQRTDAEATRPRTIDGLGTGPGQNPQAEITGELASHEQVDVYQVPMRAGDVFGATVRGGARRLELHDPSNGLVEGSELDRSASYPASSSLPAAGNASVDHVAAVTGTHLLAIRRGSGAYQARLEIRQPPTTGPQRIVLEFGGATMDTTIFGPPTPGGEQPRRLSPLRAFLERWGLRESDEPALIKRITDTVAENLRGSPSGGVGPVHVVTSTDGSGGAEFGQPNVSRVVIGGTEAESGLDTVGIAESVDPGNLAREESALVMLDGLSGPTSQPDSLNHYLKRGSDRVAFVGIAVGNIASHEAGHLLGSWHTDANSDRHDLMAPGDIVGAFGFGVDQLGGTKDDTRAKFGQDRFAPAEGFTGTEDTRNRTTVGLGGGANPSGG